MRQVNMPHSSVDALLSLRRYRWKLNIRLLRPNHALFRSSRIFLVIMSLLSLSKEIMFNTNSRCWLNTVALLGCLAKRVIAPVHFVDAAFTPKVQ